MKKSLVTLIIILVIIGITSAFYIISKDNPIPSEEDSNPILTFTVGECDLEIDSYSEPIAGVISEGWLNEDTLLIKAYLKTSCAGAEIKGGFEIEKNKINLKYIIIAKGAVTQCNCAHELNYKISNLEKKDYFISFDSEQISPQGEDIDNCVNFRGIVKSKEICCENLKPMESCGTEYKPSNSEADKKGCVKYRCNIEICYTCGNGICEDEEDPCRCPEDCKVMAK